MKTDYKTIQVEIRDNVAVFVMNNPPVNQLSAQFRSDLAEAFGEAYGDETVKAIVLTGTGKNFIAGADITEIQHVENKDELVSGMMEGMKFMNHIEIGSQTRGGGHQRQLSGRGAGNCDVLPLSGSC